MTGIRKLIQVFPELRRRMRVVECLGFWCSIMEDEYMILRPRADGGLSIDGCISLVSRIWVTDGVAAVSFWRKIVA
jgi:hypothetical protein